VLSLILLLIFYGWPYAIEPNPRFIDSWVHGRSAKGILENGRLQLEEFRYHAYPASFIFLSSLSTVTGIEVTSLLRITPLIYITVFFLFLILLFNKVFYDIKKASISTIIYGLSTFYLAFHFSPEIFGWLFLFSFLTLIAMDVIKNKKSEVNIAKKYLVLILLIIFGLTITHLVTQFVIIILMLVFIIIRKKINSKIINLRIFFFTAISSLAFSLSFSLSYIYRVIEGFRMAFKTVLYDITSSIAAQPLTTYYPPEVATLILYRRILYAIVIVTGALGAFSLRKEKRRSFVLLSSIIFVSLLLVPLTVFGILPLERTIKLAFIPISAFSAHLILKNKKMGIVLLSILLFTIPINFASFYWNEAGIYMTHDWELASAQFICAGSYGALLAEYKETTICKFYGNFSKTYDDFHIVGKRPAIFNSTFIKEQNVKIIQITQLAVLKESWARRKLDINQFLNYSSFNCIYSSEYSIIISNNNAK